LFVYRDGLIWLFMMWSGEAICRAELGSGLDTSMYWIWVEYCEAWVGLRGTWSKASVER